MARASSSGLSRVDWPARLQALARESTIPMFAAFYGAGTVGGDTPLAETPFVALDLETTGMDSQTGAIVSIGLVPFTLQRIRVAEARYWVVRPRRELAAESVLIHHITHEELVEAPRFSAVLPDLLEALAGRVVVVHYRRIERPFLDQVCRRWMGEGLAFPLIDTMTIEAWCLHKQRSWLDRLGSWLGIRRHASLRLAACRERYHLPVYAAHHAMTDALATAELFQAQVAWHLDAASPVRRWWL
ncbi:MAG: 3'-5' exonuclease [Wenzhouxiangella sp.]